MMEQSGACQACATLQTLESLEPHFNTASPIVNLGLVQEAGAPAGSRGQSRQVGELAPEKPCNPFGRGDPYLIGTMVVYGPRDAPGEVPETPQTIANNTVLGRG